MDFILPIECYDNIIMIALQNPTNLERRGDEVYETIGGAFENRSVNSTWLVAQPLGKWRHRLEGLAVTIRAKDKIGDATVVEEKPEAKDSVPANVEVPKYGRPVSREGKASGRIFPDCQVEAFAC